MLVKFGSNSSYSKYSYTVYSIHLLYLWPRESMPVYTVLFLPLRLLPDGKPLKTQTSCRQFVMNSSNKPNGRYYLYRSFANPVYLLGLRPANFCRISLNGR